jgi:hypothetical protein
LLYANMTASKNKQREIMKKHVVWYGQILWVKIILPWWILCMIHQIQAKRSSFSTCLKCESLI